MPLSQGWTKYEAGAPPGQVGVYELSYNKQSVVYIGSGGIAGRLRQHAQDSNLTFTHYRCEITNSRRRARQRERAEQRQFERKKGRLPSHNKQVG